VYRTIELDGGLAGTRTTVDASSRPTEVAWQVEEPQLDVAEITADLRTTAHSCAIHSFDDFTLSSDARTGALFTQSIFFLKVACLHFRRRRIL
jgi:hypothetical protein